MDSDPLSWLGPLASVRAFHIAACMALAALWMFSCLISTAPPPDWRRWIMRWTWLLLPIVAVGGAAWFALVCMQMTDLPASQALKPAMMTRVLTRTEFGAVFLLRAAMLVACIGAAAVSAAHPTKISDALLALFALALLVSLAWVGHAHVGQPPELHLAVDAAHLGMCALWPAGLWPMLMRLRLAPLEDATTGTLKRFSSVSLLAVLFLAITGTLNSLFMLQMWSDLIGSTYGRILLVKIFLFVALVALGALHRLRWLPAIARVANPRAIARVRQTIAVEIAIVILILLAVGWLGTIAPPYMPGM